MSVIKRSDLINDSALNWPKEYLAELDKIIVKSKQLGRKTGGTASQRKSLNELQKVERQLAIATERSSFQFIKQKAALDSLNTKTRTQIKSVQNVNDAYSRLNKKLENARRAYLNLALAGKGQSVAAQKNLAEAKRLEKQFTNLEGKTGKYTRKVGGYTEAIKEAGLETGKTSKGVGAMSNTMKTAAMNVKMFLISMGSIGLLLAFVRAISGAFNILKDFDKQLIAVRKTTGLSAADMKLFEKEVIAIGLSMKGISIQGLLEMSEIAGQLGIKGRENLLKFSATMEQLTLTSDIIGQESARSFAKFIEVSKDTVENADRLGSVITNLGNNFATSESQILANSTEIQKGIAIYDANAASVLALGAATSALGSAAEQARSGMQKTFSVLNLAAATGKNLNEILRITGQTAEEFREEFSRDSVNVFNKFIKGLSESAKKGENLTLILKKLGLSERRTEQVIGVLAKNYNILSDALERSSTEYKTNSALQKEADLAASSLESTIGDLSDSWAGFVLALDKGKLITSASIAVINFLSGGFQNLADFISNTDRELINWKINIKKLNPDTETLTKKLSSLNKKIIEHEALLRKARDTTFQTSDAEDRQREALTRLSAQVKFINELLEKNAKKEVDGAKATAKALLEKAKATKLLLIESKKQALADREAARATNIWEKSLKRLKPLLPSFTRELSFMQKALLKVTESFFGKSTIDEDAKKFLKKTGETIDKLGAKINGSSKDTDKDENERISKRDEILSKSFQLSGDLANRFTDLRLQQIDQELRALEFARNRDLESAGDNALRKAQINDEFNKKEKALKNQAARAEKRNALFQIAIGTAVSVSRVAGNIPLMIIAAAAGLAQAIFVAATSVPQFDKGKKRTPKDYVAGEKSPELRKSKGKWSIVDKPTLFKDSANDTIISSRETDSILGTIHDLTGNNLLTDKGGILSLMNNNFNNDKPQKENIAYILKRNNEDLIKTIQNKKEVNVSVNTSGAKVYERSGNVIVNRVDYYYSR